MTLLILSVLAMVIGVSMGLSGIGGFLVVPLMVTVAGAEAPQAVFTALTVNLLVTVSSGALAMARRGIDRRYLAYMVTGSALGAVLSAWLVKVLTGAAADLVIAAFLAAIGIVVIGSRSGPRRGASFPDPRVPGLALLGLGSLAQVSAALVGIGGPAITVPVLSAVGGSIDRVVGTALLHGAFVSAVGLVVTRTAGAGFDPAAVVVIALVVVTATVVSLWRQRLSTVVPLRSVIGGLALLGAVIVLLRP
ncbi:MAG TPA: sulfite exporter TauE/SafE family protein [Trueperaceae bacterium]|nr:sulfite exporter TauE/SafE family protein [Trueperaceae bacterium]